MDRTTDYYLTGKAEGVMELLQQLSEKDGFTVYPTKKYVIDKLTELKLSKYIEPVITTYYSKMTKEDLKKRIALLIVNKESFNDIKNMEHSEEDPRVKAKLPLAQEILDIVQDYLDDVNDLLVK
jgi:hypothetical protein